MIDLHVPLFRAHLIVRVVLVCIAVGLDLVRVGAAAQPALLIVACGVMVVVTAATALLYIDEQRRKPWVFIADVAVTILLILVSPLILGPGLAGDLSSVAMYWSAAAPLAVALWRGWVVSVVAAVGVAVASLVVVPVISPRIVADQALLLLLCLTVGYFTSRLRVTTREREQMYAVAAGMAERQRLARIVHDGVLQVLAMVEREGRAMGPRGLRLARAAHDQEAQLRALLQDTDMDVTAPSTVDVTHTNLSAILDKHASHSVSIATPAGTVLVDPQRAIEINAAITEALTNVTKHAGPDAKAWVLLEREGDELIVSIRDNGRGGLPAEFTAAADRGRMGMRHSIHGRLADLGGTATLRTAPGRGTEWEFRIPVMA